MIENDLVSEKIIECAIQVHKKLGSGYLESVYEAALMVELERAGFALKRQYPIIVKYDGITIGNFIADIVVNDTYILELKAVQALLPIHEAQLVNYLTATGYDVGLLINFGKERIEIKRKYRIYKAKTQT